MAATLEPAACTAGVAAAITQELRQHTCATAASILSSTLLMGMPGALACRRPLEPATAL